MDAAELTFGRLHVCTFEQALELKNKGFEGYYTDMTSTMEQLLAHFAANAIRPDLSVVAYWNNRPVGFVFIALKKVGELKLAWNGGTGVFPEYRGKGIAKAMMQEAQRIIRAEQVDRAILEVVTINSHAIAAYERGGFAIQDRLIGLTKEGPLHHQWHEGELPEGIRLKHGKAIEAGLLSFYRDKAAWSSICNNIPDGEVVIVLDASGEAAGYALYRRLYNEKGQLASIALYQCEAAAERPDKDLLIRIMLQEVYGPGDCACTRRTVNLSMACPAVIEELKEADFTVQYEQYLMIYEKMNRS